MSSKDFSDKLNHAINNKIQNRNIPEGYTVFIYKKRNISTEEYDTRPLDELDKKLLPDILNKSGFKYIVKENCIYVEKELIDNQDFLEKVIRMLNYKRGDAPFEEYKYYLQMMKL